MNSARAKRLKEHCRETTIRLDQARRDGKLIPDLGTIMTMYEILAEVLEHIEFSETSKL